MAKQADELHVASPKPPPLSPMMTVAGMAGRILAALEERNRLAAEANEIAARAAVAQEALARAYGTAHRKTQ